MLDTDAKLQAAGQSSFVDWRTYSHAVHRFLAGEPIYAATQLHGPYLMAKTVNIGYSYPPPSLLFLLPFASEPAGLVAWLAINATLLISGVAGILRRELGLGLAWALALTTLSLGIFYPFASGMAVGNVNVAIAGLFAWTWMLRDRAATIGALAGVAAIIKVFPGILIFWPQRRGTARATAVAALIVFALAFASLPLFGTDAWRDFVVALSNQQPTCRNDAVSVACIFVPVVGLGLGKLLGIAIGAVFVVLAVLARSPFVRFACIAGAMLAPVTDGWPHYWLFPYVVIVAGVASIVGRRLQIGASRSDG
jgi:hypothetical protein